MPSSRTGGRGLLVRSSLLWQAAHRLRSGPSRKRHVVALMRLEMVGDGRWRNAACFQAEAAQRLDAELMRPAVLPSRGGVPALNFGTIRHRGRSLLAYLGCVVLVLDPVKRPRAS